MKVINSIDEMRQWSRLNQIQNNTIGLVPTMGFLHEGHLSLIRKARQISNKLAVSIFVNPSQFAAGEDFDKYPSDIERDIAMCKNEQVDTVFIPHKKDMYKTGHQTFVNNEEVGHILCGISRPTHFRGVATIVAKLFNIVDADYAVFGQKDAQQAIILKNMVRDLNFRTQIIIEPIVRENDGLAMSSRNKYLSLEQRKNALILHTCVKYAEEAFAHNNKNTVTLQKEIKMMINKTADCKVDYVEFVNADTLKNSFEKGDEILFAVAVFVGKTRLIDNTVLNY